MQASPAAALALFLALAAPPSAAAAQPAGPAREPYTVTVAGAEHVVERGRFSVPENRASPSSPQIQLTWVRLPSRAAQPGPPIVYLDGGPGGSGIGLLQVPEYWRLFDRLRDAADVVVLAQRGTSPSVPFPACAATSPPPPELFADGAAAVAWMGAEVRACAAQWRERGIDPAAYHTESAADDVEALRQALGAERISLLGFSYGTHLAIAVLRRHGEHVHRVVLAGTEGPDHTLKLPGTLDAQLAGLSRMVAADSVVGAALPDLAGSLRRVAERLEAEPVRLAIGSGPDAREILVGRAGLLYLVARDLGDSNDLPALPALVHSMEAGDYSLLRALAERRFGQAARGVALMPVMTDCASGATAARLARIRLEEETSFFGAAANFPYPRLCAAVGEPDLGDAFRAPLSTPVPTLFVSGTLDSQTPPWQAVEVARGFSRAVHLVVANAGHESTLPDPAVQEVVAAFLAGDDVRGRTAALPPLRFLPVDWRPSP
jgi:pimeloyl-ACP methyl ester carboxylesterase